MIQPIPQKRVSDSLVEQIVDVAVPEIREQKVEEILEHNPQESVQNFSVERIVEASVPQTRKKGGEVIRCIPREQISDCVVEHIMFLNGRWVTVAGGDAEFF